MKTCPFCAEEIKPDAIKCRYCQSFLSTAPGEAGEEEAEGREARGEGDRGKAKRERGSGAREGDRPRAGASRRDRKHLYQGVPSWRAFLGLYAGVVLGTLLVPLLANWIAARTGADLMGRILAVAVPGAAGAFVLLALNVHRRSKIVKITTSHVETEYGILSKKIDILELWRCRDIRYRQTLADRLLRIAHIEIFTTDTPHPSLRLAGMPASRRLFEDIRDAIEDQRQRKS